MQPTLFLVIGLPGTGKTTVAQFLQEKTGAVLLRADVIRRELFPERNYSAEETAKVFHELVERGKKELSEGRSVILDAVFSLQSERDLAFTMAHDLKVPVQIAEIILSSDEIVKQRISARTGDVSEAQFEQYLMIKEKFQPIQEDHNTIDNSGSPEDARRAVQERLLTRHIN